MTILTHMIRPLGKLRFKSQWAKNGPGLHRLGADHNGEVGQAIRVSIKHGRIFMHELRFADGCEFWAAPWEVSSA